MLKLIANPTMGSYMYALPMNLRLKRTKPTVDQKSIRDSLRKTLFSSISNLSDDELSEKLESILGVEIVNRFLKKAGKGKDELIQILGKEIGYTLAAVLKEPLSRMIKANQIKITIELVQKDEKHTTTKKKTTKAKIKSKVKTKTS